MSLPAGRLPSLGGLRAFEAAGRHLSFTRAADELHVTQAAISHQIRELEEELGLKLFVRLNQALRLSEAGELLLPHVRDGFGQLRRGVDRLREIGNAGVLKLTAPPSFAGAWLVPRLHRFQARHPEIEVHLLAGIRMLDYAREGVDVGIRYGRGNWPGLHVERLLSDDLFPVCSPALAAGLKSPGDLAGLQLLHIENFPDDWRRWLQAAGAGDVDPERGSWFDSVRNAYDAAASGMGVALGRPTLMGDLLATGRLVRPFDVELPAEVGYYLVSHPHGLRLPKVEAFGRWLRDEVEAYLSR
ncbi:MAG TPA: transcriptional regulator GcvA [Geminicoccaceae bacterium]|nr:transcriptional regulator GcvA [Geminicoccus sp.]HMU49372.1 transcriptional regulator GcvA [Geminicoccaceae bacterium]